MNPKTEEKVYKKTFGTREIGIRFKKQAGSYSAKSWGAGRYEIAHFEEQIRDWLTTCIEDFGEVVGERLALSTYRYDNRLMHELEPMKAQYARESDLNPAKMTYVVDRTKIPKEALDEIAKIPGVRVREMTDAERDQWGLP